MFPALALFDQLGPRRSQFGAHTFQRLDILGPAHLQGLVLGGRQAQRVALALLGVGPLACLRQFLLQAGMAFQPLAIVAVELHQVVVLGGQGLVGLPQGDLQLLHLVRVPTLLLLTLVLDRGAVVLKGFPGMVVLLFQRFRMGVVLGHANSQARDPFLQLSQFGGAAGHLAPGSVARLAFGLQCYLGALQLRTEQASLLPGLLQRLGAFLELRLEARLGLRNDRVGLAVQPLGEAGDEVLKRVAHGHLRANALPLILFQLPQIAVDGGLGPRIAERYPDRVDGRMRARCAQAIAGALHIAFVQPGPCHASLRVFRNVLHTM
ncbi:hypothetical protein XACJM35_2950002 [Xanthomonas citri pv. citri]|nr:hypothetical protein XACLE3_9220002 [Xanthomonas citri pv. citri]CEL49708.1 hypothetical protein XACJM35_2950002 [Xanthomonas citri pv. citri]